jgi:hypothetical protein
MGVNNEDPEIAEIVVPWGRKLHLIADPLTRFVPLRIIRSLVWATERRFTG